MSIASKLQTIAENEPKVFEKGCEIGYAQGSEYGVAAGREEGRQIEYNAFWDTFFPKTPTSVNTAYLFSGRGWNNDTFKPNKDLVLPEWAQRYFYETGELDLKARLEELGLKLDLSKCKNITYLAYQTQITRLPELDCRNIGSLAYFIYHNSELVSIDKVILSNSGNQTFANTSFGANYKLEQVTFEGWIDADISLKDCPLNKSSIESVFSVLVSVGSTLTLKKSAVDKAFETSEGANDGSTSQEWLDLIDTKHLWTVSLV